MRIVNESYYKYRFKEEDIPNILVRNDGNRVKVGDKVCNREELYTVIRWQKPVTPTKSGYVTAMDSVGHECTLYAGCFGCKFVKEVEQ